MRKVLDLQDIEVEDNDDDRQSNGSIMFCSGRGGSRWSILLCY